MDMNGGEFAGFIPRSATALFEGLAEVCRSNPSIEVTVKVTYVEVYMETIRDLLEPTSINLEVGYLCSGCCCGLALSCIT